LNFDQIQQQFITEASAAPTLFADLAKVELYIAESYRTRAFTELLQNADDAKSTKFLACYYEDKLIVANNGNVFTPEDLIALCRSGSSNKKRGAGTIGYRGIGFKSLAGIAKEITVISGELAFKFSKDETQQALNINQDVPLIRVPHYLEESNPTVEYARSIQKSESLTTVFVMSGLNLRVLREEIDSFDENSILFINSVRNINIDLPNLKRNIFRHEKHENNITIETIETGNEVSTWFVAEQDNSCEKVAFKYLEKSIIPCPIEDSLIHAFLPTNECSGAYLKFNGDFSTDPSRKTIDLDDLSTESFNNCCLLLANLLRDAIQKGTLQGIFTTLISDTPIHGKFRKLLREQLIHIFDSKGINIPTQGVVKLSELRLPPDWINYDDYEGLCNKAPHLPISIINSHPNIIEFFKWIGAKSLTILESISFLANHQVSPIGSVQVMIQFTRQFRYDMTSTQIDLISSSPILPIQNGMLSPEQYSGETFNQEFISYIKQIPEIDDIKFLFKRLKLPTEALGIKEKNIQISALGKAPPETSKVFSRFKHQPEIKKWRSAELNAATWFESLSVVAAVKDVSKANIGYDLDVLLRDGKQYQVEVKSVKSFADLFRMTNNEHATAYQHGDSYLLVFIVNSDPFELEIVQNPIRALSLEKRCEQWTWVCEDYASQFVDLFNIDGEQ